MATCSRRPPFIVTLAPAGSPRRNAKKRESLLTVAMAEVRDVLHGEDSMAFTRRESRTASRSNVGVPGMRTA
jgi:hypothetical protein